MAEAVAAPAFKKRGAKASNIRKRPATPPPDASDSDESEYSTDDDSAPGVRVKRRRKDGVKVATSGPQAATDLSKSTTYAADRNTAFAANDSATKVSRLYSEAGQDESRRSAHDASSNGVDASDGTYKGTSTYGSFIQKSADAPVRQVGPIKAPTNIRTITTTDFAPDVCKDYKQTGFCGFGDGCKFLHAREDYAQGWQLDKEWEKAGSKSKGKSGGATNGGDAAKDGDDEEKMLENIPFACIICKQPYKMPVVTKCGHYFCEKCAMQRYMKEKKRACAACGADTSGTFQIARKLKDLLEKKKQRMEERARTTESAEDGQGEEKE